ncbi:hypothetical protein KSF73_15465 [Burkholderiaceae bacterium DAT-1]|nr:hypothetical protein [Burkholderiaceae bacterium DAT-1]
MERDAIAWRVDELPCESIEIGLPQAPVECDAAPPENVRHVYGQLFRVVEDMHSALHERDQARAALLKVQRELLIRQTMKSDRYQPVHYVRTGLLSAMLAYWLGVSSDQCDALFCATPVFEVSYIDPNGRPGGLLAESVPLVGQIVALVNFCTALQANQSGTYSPFGQTQLDSIRQHRGTLFDAQLIDTFIAHIDDIHQACEAIDALPTNTTTLNLPKDFWMQFAQRPASQILRRMPS